MDAPILTTRDTQHYYWGDPDSNVDWCEPNYAVTTYVAEFWNTMSSVPLVMFGLLGYYFYLYRYAPINVESNSITLSAGASSTVSNGDGNKNGKTSTTQHTRIQNVLDLLSNRRYSIAFLMIAAVGIGSTFFHATLRRYAQCLDELPMLWTAYLLLYNSIDYKSRPTNSDTIEMPLFSVNSWFYTLSARNLQVLLTSICIGLTIIYFYLPHLYVVFFIGYSLGVVSFASLMYYHIIYCYGRETHQHFSHLPRKLYWNAFFGYFGGFALWVIENTFCSYLPTWFLFHSIWHISAGIGTYYTVQCQLAWRAEEHGVEVRLKPTPLGLDYVAVSLKV